MPQKLAGSSDSSATTKFTSLGTATLRGLAAQTMDVQQCEDLVYRFEEQKRQLEFAAERGLELLEHSSALQVSLTLVIFDVQSTS